MCQKCHLWRLRLDPLPDGKGDLTAEEQQDLLNAQATSSQFMMDEGWYVVRSVPLTTNKGTVIVRHECDKAPKETGFRKSGFNISRYALFRHRPISADSPKWGRFCACDVRF